MKHPAIEIRPATQKDIEILWVFLAIAAYEPDGAAARMEPVVAAHLQDWPRGSDFGFIAWQGSIPVGAAWVKQFSSSEEPSVYFDDTTPELSIGVLQDYQGRGIGSRLLDKLLNEARSKKLSVCLTVRHTNPAVRLYASHGFVRVPQFDVPNRVGGISQAMHWSVEAQA